MSFSKTLIGGFAAALLALPALACEMHDHATASANPLQMLQNASGFQDGPIVVTDAYARSARPDAPSGAAFMAITNTGEAPDRLIAARSDIAVRVELHTHIDNGQGVMRMVHVEEGFEIGAGETLLLERGGKHVMFMGLTESMDQGEMVTVTLVFEKAGEIEVTFPVDLTRMPGAGMGAGGSGAMGQPTDG